MTEHGRRSIPWFLVAIILYAFILAYYFNGAFKEPRDYRRLGTDGILHACTIQWALHNVNQDSDFAITEAPIYFPCPYARFYGEHLLGHLIFAWPLSFFMLSPVSLLVALYMVNMFVMGIATYFLCIQLTRSPPAALISGAFFMIGTNFVQIHNTALGWGILAIFFFIRHRESEQWSDIIGFVTCSIVAGLGSFYICLFNPIAILILFVTRVACQRTIPSRKWFLQLMVASVVIVASLSPSMAMYKKTQDTLVFRRDRYMVEPFIPFFISNPRLNNNLQAFVNKVLSADTITRSRFIETVRSKLISSIRKGCNIDGRGSPIVCSQIIFVLYGLFVLAKKRIHFQGWLYSFLALTILSFWMSTFQVSPYRILFFIPGFNGIRLASNWKPYFSLGLAVLSSMVLAYLFGKKLRFTKVVIIVLSVVLLFCYSSQENIHFSYIRRFKGGTQSFPVSLAVYDYLKALPKGAVLTLPVPGDSVENEVISSVRMMYQLSHGKPIVAGYSSFMPPLSQKIYQYLKTNNVSNELIDKAATTGIRYIVVDSISGKFMEICNRLRSLSQIAILYDNKDGMIIELPKTEIEKDMSRLLEIWS